MLWTDLAWRDYDIGYRGKGAKSAEYQKNMGMLKQAMAQQALGIDFSGEKPLTDLELYEAGRLT